MIDDATTPDDAGRSEGKNHSVAHPSLSKMQEALRNHVTSRRMKLEFSALSLSLQKIRPNLPHP